MIYDLTRWSVCISFFWLFRHPARLQNAAKSYLRATMSQERLNHVALLHVHQNRLDNLDLAKIKSMFISANDIDRACLAGNKNLAKQSTQLMD